VERVNIVRFAAVKEKKRTIRASDALKKKGLRDKRKDEGDDIKKGKEKKEEKNRTHTKSPNPRSIERENVS
jgi:hypothetical protein